MTGSPAPETLFAALERIESALQRAPVMCASPATWVADEGEPAMDALRDVRALTSRVHALLVDLRFGYDNAVLTQMPSRPLFTPPARVTAENVERVRKLLDGTIKAHNDAMMALAADVHPYTQSSIDAHEQTIRDNLAALAAELDAANARADAADLMCAKAGSIAADAVADLEATKRERDEAVAAALFSFGIGTEEPPDEVFRFFQRLHDLPEIGSPTARLKASEAALAAAQDALWRIATANNGCGDIARAVLSRLAWFDAQLGAATPDDGGRE